MKIGHACMKIGLACVKIRNVYEYVNIEHACVKIGHAYVRLSGQKDRTCSLEVSSIFYICHAYEN